MAGIGFELRRILKPNSLISMAKVYGYSAILSSGPWVISIVAIIFVGFINLATTKQAGDTVAFQVVITYAIALASSMTITGFVQLPFTRFLADEIFGKREDEVLPAYLGVLMMVWIAGFVLILPLVLYVFYDQSDLFILIAITTYMALGGVWISNIIAASLKYYNSVVLAYLFAYAMIVILSFFFGKSLEILTLIFCAGNVLLLIVLMLLIIKRYESKRLISLKFFGKNFYWSLGFAGFFYTIGAWVDKFIFWFHPLTGYNVIGRLNASVLYDIPIFVAYLSILPGMAVFFFRLESDFAEKYEFFYDAVRDGGTLAMIRRYRNEMSEVVRHAIREIVVIQGIMNIFLFLYAPQLFNFMHIPQLYLGLFFVLTVGAQLQLGFMSVMAILYYLDRRHQAMWLSIGFFVLNTTLTLLSIEMGPTFFGYGYAVSLLIMFTISVWVIRNELKELDYETFMLR